MARPRTWRQLARIAEHVFERNIGQLVGDDVTEFLEPEIGHGGEYGALAGDGCGHDHVEGRQAVGGDDQQVIVADGVDVAHLAAVQQGQGFDVGLEQGVSHDIGSYAWEKPGVKDAELTAGVSTTGIIRGLCGARPKAGIQRVVRTRFLGSNSKRRISTRQVVRPAVSIRQEGPPCVRVRPAAPGFTTQGMAVWSTVRKWLWP